MEDFELRLKTRLFERTSRGIMLTDAGLTVRDLAQSMARAGGMILRNVAKHDSRDVGRVRLAAPDGVASYLLAPRLPKFHMAHPKLQVSIDCGLWAGSMLAAEPDLYLEMTEDFSPDLVSIPIATLHYAPFASREYLDLYGTPKTVAELIEHRTIGHTSHREQRSTWTSKAAAVNQLAESSFISNSSAATFQAVCAGVGIALMPTYVAMLAPDLVMLELELGLGGSPLLFLRHHSFADQQRRVKLVKDWLLEVFDPASQPWFRKEFVHPDDFGGYVQANEPPRPVRKLASGGAG